MPDESPTGRPTVQLLHELPDGSAHVDWLLGRDRAGREPLITYRLPGRVDELAPGGTLTAEHIGDHRSAYLSYEGPVSGGRGAVRRLRAGLIVDLSESPDGWELEVVWEAEEGDRERRQRLRGRRGTEPAWTVSAVS